MLTQTHTHNWLSVLGDRSTKEKGAHSKVRLVVTAGKRTFMLDITKWAALLREEHVQWPGSERPGASGMAPPCGPGVSSSKRKGGINVKRWVPTLPLMSVVTLSKLPDLTMPQFPHLPNHQDYRLPHMLLGDEYELVCAKCLAQCLGSRKWSLMKCWLSLS